jgi:hypothetical protein
VNRNLFLSGTVKRPINDNDYSAIPRELRELTYILDQFDGVRVHKGVIDYRGAYVYIKAEKLQSLHPIVKSLPRSLAGFRRWELSAENIEIEPAIIFRLAYKFRLLSENRVERGERFYEDLRWLCSNLAERWKPTIQRSVVNG